VARRSELSSRDRLTPGNDAPEAVHATAEHASESLMFPGDPPGGRRGMRLPRTFDSFKGREFRWFYLSMLGQMASMNMQLVVRAYLAYVLTGSYAALGLVGLAGAAPNLVFSVFGGVLADRQPKKTVLQIGQLAGSLNAAGLALIWFLGMMRFEWLLVSAIMHAMTMSLTMPARQAMIPDVVGPDKVMNAVALNMAGMNSMRLFAPALGGFIIAWVGFGWAFVAMAGLYGLGFVALLQVTWTPASAPGKAGQSPLAIVRSSFADIGEGIRYIIRDRPMAALLSVSFISSIFGMPYQFLLPGYVADIFDTGSDDANAARAGVMMSISAIGALAGALLLATIAPRKRGWLLLGGSVLLGVGLWLFAQTSDYWIAAVFIIVVGVGSAFRQALSQGLLQAYVEQAYRGRVMAVFMTQMSIMQLSTFFVGVLAEFIGIRVAMAGLGVGLIITVAIFAVFVPTIRRME